MHNLSHYNPLRPGGYSAKNVIKPIAFLCVAPSAERVTVMGDFNDWDSDSHPMNQTFDGAWRVEVPLSHGHHHYLFCIDGKPVLDPRAQGIARNVKGEKVSLISVS
ncbi:MAG: isoamylase early set domain-containing protein [Verrucomicrobia bacterium]|nr:isoamylase early set domain-containing protein [Verrucomicrobiota bacterium]